MTSTSIKEIVEIIQSILTSVAIVISGFWGYWLFVQNRQRFPRASITHHIFHRHATDHKLLLHVTVTITNIGNILLSLISLETRAQWVLPLSDEDIATLSNKDLVPKGGTEVEWPLIDSREIIFNKGEYEIEPGESQEMHYDFFLDDSVQTIAIYSYLKNQKKHGREIGWNSTSLYDIALHE